MKPYNESIDPTKPVRTETQFVFQGKISYTIWAEDPGWAKRDMITALENTDAEELKSLVIKAFSKSFYDFPVRKRIKAKDNRIT